MTDARTTIAIVTIKISLSIFLHHDGEEISELNVDVDRILFEGDQLIFLRDGEVSAELPATAIREIALPRKTYSIQEIRTDHPKAYEPWTPEEEQRLRKLHKANMPINDIAKQLGRQTGSIQSRLGRLDLA
jgi:hypothetical protein